MNEGFFLVDDDNVALGADGVERPLLFQLDLIRVPKFADVPTLKAFIRWAGIDLRRWSVWQGSWK